MQFCQKVGLLWFWDGGGGSLSHLKKKKSRTKKKCKSDHTNMTTVLSISDTDQDYSTRVGLTCKLRKITSDSFSLVETLSAVVDL